MTMVLPGMRFPSEYLGPVGDGRFNWRFWDPWRERWWTFSTWLELHQRLAYAAGWRAWAATKGKGWGR